MYWYLSGRIYTACGSFVLGFIFFEGRESFSDAVHSIGCILKILSLFWNGQHINGILLRGFFEFLLEYSANIDVCIELLINVSN